MCWIVRLWQPEVSLGSSTVVNELVRHRGDITFSFGGPKGFLPASPNTREEEQNQI